MTNNLKSKNKFKTVTIIPIYKKWSTYIYLLSGGLLVFLIYIFYRISIQDTNFYKFCILPLFLGLIYENRRLSSKWKTIGFKTIGALSFSLIAFFPGKHESPYDFDTHIQYWPFCFIAIFTFISAVYHDKKVVPKLTEGITLIQSISLMYWIYDTYSIVSYNLFLIIFISISVFFTFYVIIHSVTYLPLGRRSRLFLSIWSSIIMIIFSSQHVWRVFNDPTDLDEIKLTNGILLFFQFFVLGISSMYILQNFFMLAEYFPNKTRFYGKNHLLDIKKMNLTHIERYSNVQLKIKDSILCILYCFTFYYTNFTFKLMPKHTVIWVVFLSFPIFIRIKNFILKLLL